MQVDVVETAPRDVEADVLGFTVRDPAALPPAARELDGLVRGRLSHLLETGELSGSHGALALVHTVGELGAERLAAAGVGAAPDPDAVRSAAAQLAARTGRSGGRTLAWVVGDDEGLSAAAEARAAVEGLILGRYDLGRWKSNGTPPAPLERIVICGPGAAEAGAAARRAAVVAGWANRCRDVVNAPPNELTPERLAAVAAEVADGSAALSFDALGPEEIEAAGMGAFAAVAQGSDNPPRLIRLRYEPEGAPEGLTLGLVGKALTFDAGGISLKPADGLEEMKSDMGGGAAVIAGLGAIAELGLPIRILGVVPACENMPGGHAYRPGDILTAANGKRIEVTNTDAEGRLILADALWHAREEGATHLLDLATLTGTIVAALGDFYAGLFGNDDAWVGEVHAAAEASGDHAWRLPLHRHYERFLESEFADLRNAPDKRRGSSIIAALFLREFVGEGPWAHVDMAGTAYLDRPRAPFPRMGATGYGVGLVTELAERLAARA